MARNRVHRCGSTKKAWAGPRLLRSLCRRQGSPQRWSRHCTRRKQGSESRLSSFPRLDHTFGAGGWIAAPGWRAAFVTGSFFLLPFSPPPPRALRRTARPAVLSNRIYRSRLLTMDLNQRKTSAHKFFLGFPFSLLFLPFSPPLPSFSLNVVDISKTSRRISCRSRLKDTPNSCGLRWLSSLSLPLPLLVLEHGNKLRKVIGTTGAVRTPWRKLVTR